MARMRVLGRDGVHFAEVDDPHEASVNGSYWNAVHKLLSTGDDSDLPGYEGEMVGGVPLETDPDWVEYWARRGDLDFEDIYEESVAIEAEPRKSDVRRERRLRLFGENPACSRCGEADPVALVIHHIFRRFIDQKAGALLCRNCHAKAHEALRDAGVDIRHDPERSFLEAFEVVVRSLAVHLQLWAQSLRGWADRLREFIRQLDLVLPGWRDIKGV